MRGARAYLLHRRCKQRINYQIIIRKFDEYYLSSLTLKLLLSRAEVLTLFCLESACISFSTRCVKLEVFIMSTVNR